MELSQTWELSHAQKAQVHSLVTICNTHDSIHLGYPLEEDTKHFLLYDNSGRLVSALGLFFSGPDCCECTAFTRPDCRKKGYFSLLLDAALAFLNELEAAGQEEYDLLFPVTPDCKAALGMLKALQAEYVYSEYIMERALGSERNPDSGLTLRFQENGLCAAYLDGRPVGSCRIDRQASSVFLYEVEILEPLRGQGLGTRLMESLFYQLSQTGAGLLRLQVSSANQAAMALYKKTGFRICETLSYYLY